MGFCGSCSSCTLGFARNDKSLKTVIGNNEIELADKVTFLELRRHLSG
jgi:hypothetical protein